MRLGIFLPTWIGDTCMATPALRAIRDRFAEDHLIAIAKPGPTALLQQSQLFNHWITFRPKLGPLASRRQLVSDLKAADLDCILLLTNSLSTAAISYLARIPRRIGYATDLRGWMLTDPVSPTMRGKSSAKQSLIEKYLI